jgi:hypothetical protein
MNQKKFTDSTNTAVFTTKFVLDGKEITNIYHDKDDGAWQFFSSDYFEDIEDVAKIIGLGEILKIDSSVLEIADMPEGYRAYRKFKGDPWTIEKND